MTIFLSFISLQALRPSGAGLSADIDCVAATLRGLGKSEFFPLRSGPAAL